MNADAGIFAYGISILLQLMFYSCGILGILGCILFLAQKWYRPMREDFTRFKN